MRESLSTLAVMGGLPAQSTRLEIDGSRRARCILLHHPALDSVLTTYGDDDSRRAGHCAPTGHHPDDNNVRGQKYVVRPARRAVICTCDTVSAGAL
jgi:hypothetical protein